MHKLPVGLTDPMPCCGKRVFEVPTTDKLTSIDSKVTCKGPDEEQR